MEVYEEPLDKQGAIINIILATLKTTKIHIRSTISTAGVSLGESSSSREAPTTGVSPGGPPETLMRTASLEEEENTGGWDDEPPATTIPISEIPKASSPKASLKSIQAAWGNAPNTADGKRQKYSYDDDNDEESFAEDGPLNALNSTATGHRDMNSMIQPFTFLCRGHSCINKVERPKRGCKTETPTPMTTKNEHGMFDLCITINDEKEGPPQQRELCLRWWHVCTHIHT